MTITLATLSQATEQEVFNQAVRHMHKQKVKSIADTSDSFNYDGWHYDGWYRGANGTKCPAGCFMSDDEYKKEFEGERWKSIVYKIGLTNKHVDLIEYFQHIHDSFEESEFKDQFKCAADKFKLKFPEDCEEW